jgi:hypothetical protein
MTRLHISRRSWVPSRRLARRTRGLVLGGFWLHLVTWSRATELDRELAAGTDPMRSDDLSLRAGQLRSAKRRARLGRALRGAVNVAETRVDPLMLPPSLIRRAEVRANRDLLLELAERLGTQSCRIRCAHRPRAQPRWPPLTPGLRPWVSRRDGMGVLPDERSRSVATRS